MVARQAHNLEVARSSPASATITSEVVEHQHFGHFLFSYWTLFRRHFSVALVAESEQCKKMSHLDKELISSKCIVQFTLPRLHKGKQWYVDFFAYDPARDGMRRKGHISTRARNLC